MCCSLSPLQSQFNLHTLIREPCLDRPAVEIYRLQGTINYEPVSFVARAQRFLRWMELAEKIAELGDETFHLLGFVFKAYCSDPIFQLLRGLHNASHEMEHTLHAFCFVGDIVRLIKERSLWEYKEGEHTQKDWLRTAARLSHMVSHFFATTIFLSELKIIPWKNNQHLITCRIAFSVVGYAFNVIALVWQRYKGAENENFGSDLAIHLGGFLFEALPLTKKISVLASYDFAISKLTAIAGLVHAWCFARRLMPKERERFHGTYEVSPGQPVVAIALPAHRHAHVH